MKVTYAPEGVEPLVWDYLPGKMLNVESELIEDVTGWTFEEFGVALLKGSMKAKHALLWVFLKRKSPGLRYETVQFTRNELGIDFSEFERKALIKALEDKLSKEGLDADEQTVLDEFREQQAAEGKPDPKAATQEPPKRRKSSAKSDASDTSSS
jgi:hypothetical protein